MKKKVLFVASLFLATATFAQDGLTSKKGETILPESGDWAIGFDATPFLNYAGNLLSGTNDNNFGGAQWTNSDMAVTGKMFKDETTAYRASFRLGLGGSSSTALTDTNSTIYGTPIYIEDVTKMSDGFSFVIGAGLEKRRGSTRIQGYYGGDLMIGMIAGGSTTYDYSAVLDSISDANGSAVSGRNTEMKNGNTFMIGVRGFIGAEWFVAPKVSIGAEYGWGFGMSSTGESSTTTESWELANAAATKNSLVEKTTLVAKSSGWGLDTDILGGPLGTGSLKINFHF